MALRHGGDSANSSWKNFPDCATLVGVREVRRESQPPKASSMFGGRKRIG
jgi:hypothetical protein